MNEFGITLIPARSPQAKGRVERLWETLQSRLPVEFKIAGITSIDQANDFLKQYIPKFNAKFAVEATNPEPIFRPLPESPAIDYVLCVKQTRMIDNGSVFSFHNRHFKVVMESGFPTILPKSQVNVLVSPKFGIKAEYKETIYEVLPYIKPKKQKDVGTSQTTPKSTYIPPDDHYFKRGSVLWKRLTFEDSNEDLLKMLENIFLSDYA